MYYYRGETACWKEGDKALKTTHLYLTNNKQGEVLKPIQSLLLYRIKYLTVMTQFSWLNWCKTFCLVVIFSPLNILRRYFLVLCCAMKAWFEELYNYSGISLYGQNFFPKTKYRWFFTIKITLSNIPFFLPFCSVSKNCFDI